MTGSGEAAEAWGHGNVAEGREGGNKQDSGL